LGKLRASPDRSIHGRRGSVHPRASRRDVAAHGAIDPRDDRAGYLAAGASLTVQPESGHMMMVEDPRAFLQIVGGCLAASGA
jgi:pimeloyl-ACP methyl ester carboxylesterase